MRVLEVIPDFGLAGAERMVQTLSTGLHDAGVEVKALSLYRRPSVITAELATRGVEVAFLDKHAGVDLGTCRDLRQFIQEYKPDVVHSHRYSGLYAGLACIGLRTVRHVHTIHNVADYEMPPTHRSVMRVLYRLGLSIPVAISPEVCRSTESLYSLVSGRTRVVFNGIDSPMVHTPRERDSTRSVFRFLTVGRFATQKNHELLIRSFRRVREVVPRVELLLVGDGEKRRSIEDLVSALGLGRSVLFTGAVSEVSRYYADADCFVLSSTYEGLPLALLEAMSAGLPCISTNVGGVPDVVANGANGILCEGTEEALSSAMIAVATDGDLCSRLSAGALRRSVDFTSSAMVSDYTKVFEWACRLPKWGLPDAYHS